MAKLPFLSKSIVLKTLHFLWSDDWIPQENLPLELNRSFLFGDGFFESMRFFPDGTNPLWPYHWDRLKRSLVALRFTWPPWWNEDDFAGLIRSRFPTESRSDLRVKIVFFRTGDTRYSPENSKTAFFLSIEPCLHPWVQTIKDIAVSETVFLTATPLSWIKTTSALPYVMAGLERAERKLDDLLLCNREGFVVEGCYSSLCWKQAGSLYFPARKLGGLDSCHRRFLEDFWTKQRLPFSEAEWKPEKVLQSEWICFGGATGIRVWLRDTTDFPHQELGLYPPFPDRLP